MKNYYAEQSPRGFTNEINTYWFSTEAARNAWVEKHKDDGDCNSAALGARAITDAKARRNTHRKSGRISKSYNSGYLNGDEKMEEYIV